MKYKNFESQIGKAFLQDSAAVDTDALIASLGIPVAVERERKIAWWMLAGLVLLSLLIVGLYSYMGTSNTTPIATEVSSNVVATSPQMNQNNNETNSIAAITVETDNKVSEQKSKEEIVAESKSDRNNSIKNSIIKNGVVLNASNENVKNTTSTNNINQELNTTNEIPTPYITDYVSEKEIIETEAAESIEVSENTEVSNVDLNFENENNRSLESVFSIDELDFNLESEKEYPGLPDPECPSFSYRIPWNISLLAEVGVMKPMKELQNNGSTADSLFTFRELNENSKEAIQLGLHAKVSKGSNPLYVRGGIAYTRIAEQMNESYDYTQQDTIRGLISITTSMTGDTVTAIYGDIISETRFTGRTVKHYFLHLWDLPIAVGYELPVAGSFYVGGEVGAQFNFRTSGSGFIFRDVNDYADLSEVTTKETKVGMSYFGGLHFGKHLSKRSSVQLSARFRYYPSTFSTVDPNIEQRYNLAGLHAGYVYRF